MYSGNFDSRDCPGITLRTSVLFPHSFVQSANTLDWMPAMPKNFARQRSCPVGYERVHEFEQLMTERHSGIGAVREEVHAQG